MLTFEKVLSTKPTIIVLPAGVQECQRSNWAYLPFPTCVNNNVYTIRFRLHSFMPRKSASLRAQGQPPAADKHCDIVPCSDRTFSPPQSPMQTLSSDFNVRRHIRVCDIFSPFD